MATILTILLGFLGADMFYLGFIVAGTFKMLLTIVVTSLTFIQFSISLVINRKTMSRSWKLLWMLFIFGITFLSFIQFLWVMFDAVGIISGSFRDAKGCSLGSTPMK
jgi:hypothetical protein